MGGIKFFVQIIVTIFILITPIHGAIRSDLYIDPKDDVEFVNPYEYEDKQTAVAAAATEADDMNTVKQDETKVPSELVITTLENMPFSGIVTENGTLKGVGYAFYFFDLLRTKMNFTYRIVLPDRNVLGDEKIGVIGQLVRKEVDMIVAFVPSLPEYRQLIKYGTALGEVEWTILMKRPGESATGSGLLAPFDTNVWILILISVLTVGPIIYTLIFLRFFFCKNGEPRKYSLATCMWFVYGALLKQGSTLSPLTDSARLLFATWWIFITILTSFYTANLTAFLTLSQFTLPIKTANDLADKNQRWFARQGGAIEKIVYEKDSEELGMLRRSVEKGYGQFSDIKGEDNGEILGLVKQNKMYIRERPHVTKLLFDDYMNKTRNGVPESNRCTFVIMPGRIMTKKQSFAFQLNTTLDVPFNKRLLSLVESGLISAKTSEHLPGTEICPLNLGSKERQLRNSDLTMTYQGMGIGFTVAIIAFATEVIYRRLIKREEFHNNDTPKLPMYGNHDIGVMKNIIMRKQKSPPPLYHNFGMQDHSKKQSINGRDYYIVRERDGEKRLVPVRTPSAFLFNYNAA